MKVSFNEIEKRIDIAECEFQFVEIYKDGLSIADIPLVDGCGFWTNQDDIVLGDNIELYPYNKIELEVKSEVIVDELSN